MNNAILGSLLVVALALSGAGIFGAYEATAQSTVDWTLTFEHQVSVRVESGAGETHQVGTNLIQAHGTATVHEQADGTLTGSGTLSISEHNRLSGAATAEQQGAGQGAFSVTGRRDGDRLLLGFAGQPIGYKLEGSMSSGGIVLPWNGQSSFEVQSIAMDGQVIGRRDGATATYEDRSAPAGGRDASITTRFTLSGGPGPEPQTSPSPTPTATATGELQNPWTLTHKMDFSSQIDVPGLGSMNSSVTCRGEARFSMPSREGAVAGNGGYECRISGSNGLQAIETGDLAMEGQVVDDPTLESGRRLSFVPKVTVSRVEIVDQALAGGNPGWDLGTFVGPSGTLDLEAIDGAQIVNDIPATVGSGGGQQVWRVSGRTLEHWAVDMSAADTWSMQHAATSNAEQSVSWGAGIRVPWVLDTRVEVDDTGCTATATLSTGPVSEVSHPLGVYAVTYGLDAPKAESVGCTKRGRAVLLDYPTGWGYAWQYTYSVSDDAEQIVQDQQLPGGAELIARQRGLPADQRSELGQGMVPDDRTYDIALRNASYVGATGESIEVWRVD